MRIAMIALVTLLAACATRGRSDGPIELTDEHNGAAVHAAPGQTIVVRLPANPSTGYRWEVDDEPDDDVVRVVTSRFDSDGKPLVGSSDSRVRMGVAGTQVWTLQAVAPGETEMQIDQLAPGRSTPERTFTLTFTVQ